MSSSATIIENVREFWEKEPCGTGVECVGDLKGQTRDFYERVESNRYAAEPFIHSVAQFTRHRGKQVLEIGVGAGTDHLQWARAGAILHGVDLTEAAIDMTRKRFAMYGFESQLQRTDAEQLPFPDNSFDIVYSWGVIHHSNDPQRIINEIERILKPGGRFIGMLYGRRSLCTARLWVRFALLAGRPWRSVADVVWHHVESIGTKAYTPYEVRRLFENFRECSVKPLLTPYDKRHLPNWLTQFVPDCFGWFLAIDAQK